MSDAAPAPRSLTSLMTTTLAELEPAAYAAWRRHMHETCLMYERPRGTPLCWAPRDDVVEYRLREGRTLYGCLRCMRTHLCRPPLYETCPRVLASGGAGAVQCPFSGRHIDESTRAVSNASFDARNATLAAMQDFVEPDGASDAPYRGIPGGRDTALRLRATASRLADPTARRRAFRAADDVRQRIRERASTQLFEQFQGNYLEQPRKGSGGGSGSGGGGRSSLREPPRKKRRYDVGDGGGGEGGQAARDPDDDGEADDGQPQQQHGGGDDVLAPLWYPAHIEIPDSELKDDDAFLATYLEPVVRRLAAPAFATCFAGPEAPPQTQTRALAAPAPSAKPRILVEPLLVRCDVHAERRPWAVLERSTPPGEYQMHQRDLLQLIARFVAAHGAVATPPGVVPRAPTDYLVFCDRLLWLRHRYAADPIELSTPRWLPSAQFIEGDGATWPSAEGVAAIVHVVLTRLLVRPAYVRDCGTDAKVFIWLPDPWLTLVSQREAGGGGGGKQNHESYYSKMEEELRAALVQSGFSPGALHAFLHPVA